jgi:hypothetical protein
MVMQTADPLPGPPLYDGVIVIEPYRWLDPPLDLPGGAEGAAGSIEVFNGRNEVVVVGTAEMPPQAQLIGQRDSLNLPAGTTSVHVAIKPVAPPSSAPQGYIDGNVYRFAVTNQTGKVVSAKVDGSVSVILRPADQTLVDATIERFDGVAWRALDTTPDQISAFIAVVTDFGDFAVVVNGVSPYQTPPALTTAPPAGTPSAQTSPAVPGPGPSPSPGPTPELGIPTALSVAGAIVAILIVAFVVWQRRKSRRGTDDPGWRQ